MGKKPFDKSGVCFIFLFFFFFDILFCLANGLNGSLSKIRGFSDSSKNSDNNGHGMEKSLIDNIDELGIDGVTNPMLENVFLNKQYNEDSFIECARKDAKQSMLDFLAENQITDSKVKHDLIATLMIKHYKTTQEITRKGM